MTLLGGFFNLSDANKVVRTAAFLITPLLVLYNLLIMNGIIESEVYSDPLIAMAVSFAWLIQGVYLYFTVGLSKKKSIIQLALYHIFSLGTTIAITGFMSPFTPMLSLLVLSTYVLYGKVGATLSAISVGLSAAISLYLYPEHIQSILPTLISTALLSTAGIFIALVQESRKKSLDKALMRERLQYERTTNIINNLTDATFTIDENGKVIMYNAACLDILDTNTSIKGKSIDKLFKLTLDGKKVKLLDILKDANRTNTRDDLVHNYSSGDEINVELTYAPMRGSFSKRSKGSPHFGYILIARNITKRKTLDEERDEFISVVSHELRTPITIAEGTLSNMKLLMERSINIDKKMLEPIANTAYEQIMFLAKMVNDLSTLSRAERGVGDELELVNTKELLHAMHNKYTEEAASKGLRLDIDLSPSLGYVYTSRLYIEELLQNFLTNSIKYTKEGSVTIIGRKSSGNITFAIKDTGIGISKMDQEKIFDKFYRSEDYRTRETGGTGLGLYVSTKLAKKLNTEISLTSRLNHGSTFSFSLPITEE